MEKDLEKWEVFIAKLIEEEKYSAKNKVIEGSEFLSFLDNRDEWESGPSSPDEVEKYYSKKWIQPAVIDPKLAYALISGSESYEFAKRWIKAAMLDKSCCHFARTSIDKFFITEICEEKSYKIENIIKEKNLETEEERNIQALELLKKGIFSYIESGNDVKELILLIEVKFENYLFSSKYTNLLGTLGKVITKKKLENNFQFALISKRDLIFRWIFWGIKWEYNAASLYTYIFLHIWYSVKKGENFSSNAVAYLKKT